MLKLTLDMNLPSVIPGFLGCMSSPSDPPLPCRYQVIENKEDKGRLQDSEVGGNRRGTIHNTSVCYIPYIIYMF